MASADMATRREEARRRQSGLAFVAATDVFPPLNDALELVPIPTEELRLALLGLMVGNTAVIFLLEVGLERIFG